MAKEELLSRRQMLRRVVSATSLMPIAAVVAPIAALRPARVRAADTPLISVDDPAAKAVKYVEDASKAKAALPGSTCANCGLYQGKSGAKDGPCQIFPGKAVTAAGWCASWAPQM